MLKMIIQRLGSARLIAVISVLSFFPASAATPALITHYGESYDELVTDGVRVWGCRYRVEGNAPAAYRLLVEDGDASIREEEVFPLRVLRMNADAGGTLYAIAEGAETGINPSIHVWKRARGLDWENVALLRSPDSDVGVYSANVGFAAGRVIVDLEVTWSFYEGGHSVNAPPPEPALLVYNPESNSVAAGPEGFQQVRGKGTLYGLRGTAITPATQLFSSVDGLTWLQPSLPTAALNSPAYVVSAFGVIPLCTSGQRLFFEEFASTDIAVMADGGLKMVYSIPFSENGYGPSPGSTPAAERYNGPELDGFVAVREGESFMGFYRRTSQTGGPDQHLVVSSDDFFGTFQITDFSDRGHVDVVANDNGFFFLRETSTGSALYRQHLPGPRLPAAARSGLSIRLGTQNFSSGMWVQDPLTGDYAPELVPHSVLNLETQSADGTVLQIETSVDLLNWLPVGLPIATGRVVTLLLNPTEPRRFFR